VLAVYPWPSDPTRYTGTYLVTKLRTDSMGTGSVGACSTQKITDALAARGAPVWRYEFDHAEGPGWFSIPGYVWGAGHAAELAYIIPHRHNLANNGAALNRDEQQLSEQMLRAWGSFVRDGDPAGDRKDSWPRFQPNGVVLSLQAGGRSTVLPVAAINASHNCAFWDGVR